MDGSKQAFDPARKRGHYVIERQLIAINGRPRESAVMIWSKSRRVQKAGAGDVDCCHSTVPLTVILRFLAPLLGRHADRIGRRCSRSDLSGEGSAQSTNDSSTAAFVCLRANGLAHIQQQLRKLIVPIQSGNLLR